MNEIEFIENLDFANGERLLTKYLSEAVDVMSKKAPNDIVRVVLWYDSENFDVSVRCATRAELDSAVSAASAMERDHMLYSSDEWEQGWYWDSKANHLTSAADLRTWHSKNNKILYELAESDEYDELSLLSHAWFRAICISALSQNRHAIVSSSKTAEDVIYYLQPHDSSALEFKLDLAQTIGVNSALELLL